MTRSHVTTHVLDAVSGRPAAGVPVALDAKLGSGWESIATAITDADGRVGEFGPEALDAGIYRVVFDTEAYFAATGQTGFYPEVSITFELADERAHYHIPLLLSPFAYSTYRGS
ncbi:hydroxyisourate hydrolase [Microbacteriaceae bacterium VKM Ac-2854]|nr:hydroxyisourate hydrolase [Microbacteriaceae bacterium VKM Ac-2854]